MNYYLKYPSEESLYNALVVADIATEYRDESGLKQYAIKDGAELDVIGQIKIKAKKYKKDSEGNIIFKTKQELVSEEVPAVLWEEGEELPENVSIGDIKEEAKPAEYKTIITEEPDFEFITEEVDEQKVQKMVASRMINIGDIKKEKKEEVLEKILIQEEVKEVLWEEGETLPEGVDVGDIKIVGQEAVYETKVINAAEPALFYTEEEVASSKEAFHANIRNVVGDKAEKVNSIPVPNQPVRVWWS